MRISDWSSDVCSSDLSFVRPSGRGQRGPCWRRRQGDGGFHRHRRSSSGLCKRLRRAPLRSRSEEHTSELQSLMRISYAVFCLKKKTRNKITKHYKHIRIDQTSKHQHTHDDKLTIKIITKT